MALLRLTFWPARFSAARLGINRAMEAAGDRAGVRHVAIGRVKNDVGPFAAGPVQRARYAASHSSATATLAARTAAEPTSFTNLMWGCCCGVT